MFRRASLGLLVCSLSLWAADAPKPAAKEAGQLDPKQFQAVCTGADVIVLGKAYAILTGTLDSEPPTPVYTTAKLQTKNLKFLKGREKLGDKVADAATPTQRRRHVDGNAHRRPNGVRG